MEVVKRDDRRLQRESSDECLKELDKAALVDRVRRLEAHVRQLQNLLQAKDGKRSAPPARPFDFSRFKRRHVALRLLYLGWDYNGYALQEDSGLTIEAALFDALAQTRLLEDRTQAHYHRCGRTDKGVSAFSQVISVDLRTNLTEGVGVFAQEGYSPDTSAGLTVGSGLTGTSFLAGTSTYRGCRRLRRCWLGNMTFGTFARWTWPTG